MPAFRTVPSDPRQAVAWYAGVASRRPAAADHDAPLIYQATDDGSLSFGRNGARITVQDSAISGAPFITTNWHAAPLPVTATAAVLNTAYAVPYRVPAGATTITGLAVSVTTLGAGSTVRLGVRARNADGTVGAVLLDAGTVATTATGIKTIASLTLAVPAIRRVFIIVDAQGGTPPSLNFAASQEAAPAATPDNSLNGLYMPTQTGVSGAFTGAFTVAALVATAPHVAVQLA